MLTISICSTGLSAEELKGAYLDAVKDSSKPAVKSGVFETDLGIETGTNNEPRDTPMDISYTGEAEFNMNNVMPSFAKDLDTMKTNYFKDVYSGFDDDDD